jgi:hypothetical protein
MSKASNHTLSSEALNEIVKLLYAAFGETLVPYVSQYDQNSLLSMSL